MNGVERLFLMLVLSVMAMALIVVGVFAFEPDHRDWFRKGRGKRDGDQGSIDDAESSG